MEVFSRIFAHHAHYWPHKMTVKKFILEYHTTAWHEITSSRTAIYFPQSLIIQFSYACFSWAEEFKTSFAYVYYKKNLFLTCSSVTLGNTHNPIYKPIDNLHEPHHPNLMHLNMWQDIMLKLSETSIIFLVQTFCASRLIF